MAGPRVTVESGGRRAPAERAPRPEAEPGGGGPPPPEAGRKAGAPPHGRALALEVEGSKERIHACARLLFARYGFEGVSLQRIADEVGLHKSSLFHHYRGKRELFREVIDAALDRVAEEVEALGRDEPPALESLLRVVDALVERFAAEPHTARLLMGVIFAPAESTVAESFAGEERDPSAKIGERVGEWLVRARKAGAVRWVSVPHTVYNLYGLVLFHPADAADEPATSGSQPFAPRAVATRKRELRRMLRGLLEPER